MVVYEEGSHKVKGHKDSRNASKKKFFSRHIFVFMFWIAWGTYVWWSPSVCCGSGPRIVDSYLITRLWWCGYTGCDPSCVSWFNYVMMRSPWHQLLVIIFSLYKTHKKLPARARTWTLTRWLDHLTGSLNIKQLKSLLDWFIYLGNKIKKTWRQKPTLQRCSISAQCHLWKFSRKRNGNGSVVCSW